MTMLQLSRLTKRYGKATALDDISLTLAAGERVALLGHNGAGKTTLMKLVLGLIAPDGGEIAVAGQVPGSQAARALTAYLPENAAFHPALSGREQIRHFLRLRGESPKRADALLERVGLGEAAGRRIGTYSKGMRQRVGLAQALIGSPRLMVLDEPTSGLDPVSRRDFYDLLDELAGQGTAILLSSHALSEVEDRTDRVSVLARGRMVAEGSLAELRRAAALPFVVHLRPRAGQAQALADAFPEATRAGDIFILSFDPARKLDILESIARSRDLIEDFDFHPPSLDDIYSHISGRAA